MDTLSVPLALERTPARWMGEAALAEEPAWAWVHLVCDVAMSAAYLTIPLVLVFLLRKRRDVPFPKTVCLFAAFILACGVTHLVEATVFYWPAYRLAGTIKAITAVVSWVTVAALFPVIPRVLKLRSPDEAEREIRRRTNELAAMTERLKEEAVAREEINRQLRDSREMLQLALTAGDTGSFNWDLSTDVVVFDQAQIQLTGLGLADGTVASSEFFERIGDAYRDEVERSVRRAIEHDSPYEARFPFNRPDGSQVWLQGRGCVVHNGDGQPVRMIGLNYDVTEQVERENELDEAAREATTASRHKSQFVAQVSHEIRTPLTAMLGCIDTLLPGLPDGEERETLRTVRSQGEMLRILLNDVLDLAKIEAGKLTIKNRSTSLTAVFAGVCSLMEPLAEEKSLTLCWQPESALPETFVCDPYRLRQVILNLVGNAIKFTRTGSVTIVSGIDAEPGAEAGELVIEVCDTGIGIEKQQLSRIFREFEQLRDREAGSGLGLAICHRLVTMMGGELTARSEVGIGSAFAVHLPIDNLDGRPLIPADQILTQRDRKPQRGVPPVTHFPLRVLAAEDTPAIQFVVKRMLGPVVDRLTVVENGRKAVDAVMSAEKTAEPFDLVLMDMQMPEVSGTEATRQLRREGFSRPIIALTAGAMEDERRECMAAGCTQFVPKPIDIDSLHQLLADVAAEKRG